MPAHNFMLEDLVAALKSVALFPLFLLIPGYVIAWLLDLFEFRRRTAAFRVALSIPLGISICPILTYLTGRFVSQTAVWVFYAAAVLAFAVMIYLDRRRFVFTRRELAFAGIAVVWLAVAVFSLIDLQIGDRLYFPTSTLDYSVRGAFVHSISTTGVPPQNPFFLPGQPVALRYHYFWLMMCSLVNQIAPTAISSRHALIGGTFWCGLGFMGLVALYLRLFLVKPAAALRRRTLIGILLLGITGLDIIPSLFFLFLYARGQMSLVLSSAECWNEYVDWFIHSAIWAPHALAALQAGFMGFLLLWLAPKASGFWPILRYSLVAGAAFASMVGHSIWVAFVFAVFLALWTIVTVLRRWRTETIAFVLAGVTCAILILPYLHDLQGSSFGEPLLVWTVRAFSLAALVPSWHGMSAWSRLILVNGPLIPLNYLLEFGFFFLVAGFKWRQYRANRQPLSRQDLACVLLLATSTLICTFLRSAIGYNDLGWRGFLVAQFVLLLWSVDLFAELRTLSFVTIRRKQLLLVFCALGVAGTVYDLAIVRFYPVLADRGVVPPNPWMSPDRNAGKRIYATRAAYDWLRTTTPGTAIVQANPKMLDTAGMLYGDRRTVAGDLECLALLGGDPALCAPIVARMQRVYPSAGQPAPSTLQDLCGAFPIDLVVAKDTDAVWANRSSWVWAQPPAYANPFVRMFPCRALTALSRPERLVLRRLDLRQPAR